MRTRKTIIFILLGIAAVILFVIDMATGAVPIPLNQVVAAIAGGDCPEMTARIVINIRLVKAVVALLAGAALSVSGLEMQTLFRNPLAGPYVLGISSGASLGVALFILGAPLAGLSGYVDSIGIVGAAWIGASAVLAVIAFVGRRITDIMVILILGIMFSSGVSAIVQVLQYLSHEDALKSFVIWTMGSLGEVTISQLIVAVPAVIAGLVLAVAAVKPLNLLLLGEDYARSMGLNPLRSRAMLFMSTTLLAGTVTAFCGPIGFIGMALPHVARMLFSDADHRVLIPACMLVGADVMLACDIISKFFTVPVNAITALVGIPIVVWVVVKNKPVTA
ncbi:FecCD family ABC transporter permease [Muribaculum intestinale]|jgi:iron complex transport system permease protein|uniref:FecCD family ABC transporter permease n=1 Tax=Muribaculum intestinale TaxID=1796646 RepID=UPI000F48AC5E|nr:iron ABC transporter permease [Muribaculum intestinale]ROT07883.1 iron ABC transporter permease [Muribaculaceae bacterium Isolate-100 (HZI)]RXE66446.1 iron ABC transporter permease [Muribaculaceae bacterium Isolate-007 (NCI)]